MWTARHLARAHYALVLGAALSCAALGLGCSADRVLVPDDGEVSLEDLSLLGQPTPIEFETYENSHQVVHPSAMSRLIQQEGHGHHGFARGTRGHQGAHPCVVNYDSHARECAAVRDI